MDWQGCLKGDSAHWVNHRFDCYCWSCFFGVFLTEKEGHGTSVPIRFLILIAIHPFGEYNFILVPMFKIMAILCKTVFK